MIEVVNFPTFEEILNNQKTQQIIAKELDLSKSNNSISDVIYEIRTLFEEIIVKENNYKGMRGSPTVEHSERVSLWATNLAKRMNQETDLVQVAALFHDVGKIVIPNDAIFNKHNLTIEKGSQLYEDRIRHVELGEEILRELGLSEIAKIVGQTHEKLDGSGYPKGLKGNEIEYISQIVTIADTIDSFLMSRDAIIYRDVVIQDLIQTLSDKTKYDQSVVEEALVATDIMLPVNCCIAN